MVNKNPPQTFLAITRAFTQFLTVAIHTILYERSIYPRTSFLTARAYNFPVRQSRHPQVCQWINDAVSAVETELLKGTVARVALVIFESEDEGRPLERFVWEVERWPEVPSSELDTKLVREGQDDGLGQADADAAHSEKREEPQSKISVDLDEQLRGVMSKLAVCSSRLKPIPEGCTFTLAIELKDESDPPIGHPQPWIPSEPSLQNTLLTRNNEAYGGSNKTTTKRGGDLGGRRTLPVRQVESGELAFEVWIEEGKAKSTLDASASV